MADINEAISYLAKKYITSFDLNGVLVVPVDTPEKIGSVVGKVSTLLKEINYEGWWQVDPYYYEKHTDFEDPFES